MGQQGKSRVGLGAPASLQASSSLAALAESPEAWTGRAARGQGGPGGSPARGGAEMALSRWGGGLLPVACSSHPPGSSHHQ